MSASRHPPPADVIPSEEILQYIHPSLLQIDYNDSRLVTYIVITTSIIFTVILFTSLWLFNCFSTFRNIRLRHRVFMCLAISRAIYGISGFILGSYAIFTHTNLDRDVVFGKTATAVVAVYFTLGFFIFELTAVVVSDLMFKSFSKMLILHHTLALLGYGFATIQDANYSFGCKALILEMSTPFSCLCFILLKAGKENSLAWKINQMILVHTFHLRSVVECHFWYITYNNWDNIWSNMPIEIFIALYSNLVLVTFVMTPYWGYKKTQQLFNPVDWNFQEMRAAADVSNGQIKKSA